MKVLLSIVAAMFIFAPFASAHHSNKDIVHVKAQDYNCADLYNLVLEEGVVHIGGFGSLDVFAEARHACKSRYCHGDNRCESYKSYWPSKNKNFCFAGYACRITTESRN